MYKNIFAIHVFTVLFVTSLNAASIEKENSPKTAIPDGACSTRDFPAELAFMSHTSFFAGIDYLVSKDSFKGSSKKVIEGVPFPISVKGTPADSKTDNLLPTIFFATPFLKKNIAFGVGVSSPIQFTGNTDYEIDSILRYNFTRSFFTTNIYTAVVAYQINRVFGIGAGIDRSYSRIKFNAAVPSNLSGTPAHDNLSINKSAGWGTGWHISFLANIEKTYTVIEIAYRSKSNVITQGSSQFYTQNEPSPLLNNNNFNVPITVPPQFQAKVLQPLSETFGVGVNYVFTQWNVINVIPFNNISAPSVSGVVDEHFNFFWKNTSLLTLGVNKVITDRFSATVIGGWSQSQYPLGENSLIAGLESAYVIDKNTHVSVNYYRQFNYTYETVPIGASIITGNTKANKNIVGLGILINC